MRASDKRVQRDNEYSDSEDEGDNRRNHQSHAIAHRRLGPSAAAATATTTTSAPGVNGASARSDVAGVQNGAVVAAAARAPDAQGKVTCIVHVVSFLTVTV